jgi:hypothetical protein
MRGREEERERERRRKKIAQFSQLVAQQLTGTSLYCLFLAAVS